MTTYSENVQEAGIPWWLVLLEGIALLILGLMFLSSPVKTTAIATQVLGIYWLIAGIFKIISIFMDSIMWGLKLFAGILGIIAGIVVLNHPLLSPVLVGSAVVIILGVQGIIMGIVGIVQAFKGAGWGAGILGAVSLLFGILLLANIWVFTISLPWAIGILALVGGIAAIIMAFKLR
ncbi:MAG: HdeD family acid-resistance protein [Chloroflexi bacterium]|nr:HdeD family acid-resistance protein [Chloroflexota bacterium]